jgi:hypothetical protein
MIVDIVLTMEATPNDSDFNLHIILLWIEMWIFVFSHVITDLDDNWLLS